MVLVLVVLTERICAIFVALFCGRWVVFVALFGGGEVLVVWSHERSPPDDSQFSEKLGVLLTTNSELDPQNDRLSFGFGMASRLALEDVDDNMSPFIGGSSKRRSRKPYG